MEHLPTVVYVVFFNNFHGEDEYCGVFSSEETARLFISRSVDWEQPSFRIVEETLDDF